MCDYIAVISIDCNYLIILQLLKKSLTVKKKSSLEINSDQHPETHQMTVWDTPSGIAY